MAGLRALDQTASSRPSFTLREPSLDDVFISLTGHAAEGERIELDDEERFVAGSSPTEGGARVDAHRDRRTLVTTTAYVPTLGGPRPTGTATRLRFVVSDTLTLTKRNILNHIRIPESFFFATVQPIMFVLLFRYVFGGAIKTPEADYVNYLMPGIFVQTVAFGSVSTGSGSPKTSKRA